MMHMLKIQSSDTKKQAAEQIAEDQNKPNEASNILGIAVQSACSHDHRKGTRSGKGRYACIK